MKGNYFCNCLDMREKTDHYAKYSITEVDYDDKCVHCGHYTVYQLRNKYLAYRPTESDNFDETTPTYRIIGI